MRQFFDIALFVFIGATTLIMSLAAWTWFLGKLLK